MRKKQMQLCQQGWGFLLMKGISSFENLVHVNVLLHCCGKQRAYCGKRRSSSILKVPENIPCIKGGANRMHGHTCESVEHDNVVSSSMSRIVSAIDFDIGTSTASIFSTIVATFTSYVDLCNLACKKEVHDQT